VANSTGSFATRISTVESNYNGLSTSVTQFSSSINGIQGKYGVTISGSAVTGFELIGGGSTSDFIVSANTFKIKTSSGSMTPFTVSGNTVSIDGSVQITGSITLSSGNTTNGVVIDSNGMKVYAGGVLRVHIGNLSA
jgi:phage baseplate assembly protein gpV